MWSIVNRTPYEVGRVWGRDKEGVHEWIVVVKATYDIGPEGVLSLAEEQVPVLLMAQYHGDPGRSSLRYDADLVGPKPTTDLLVNGMAHAPNGRPSADFMVGLRVGPIKKVLRVRGNRRWGEGVFGGKPLAAEPVLQVALRYEHAFGGYDHEHPDAADHRLDARNPVGCGLETKSGRRVGEMLPNFEYPDGNLEKSGPAGLSALDAHWSPRREFAGTYDEAWQKNRLPLLPQDWDARCLLSSPADQRPPAHFKGGELVELANLTPQGQLQFALPRVHLGFRTRISGQVQDHRAQMSSVIVEPEHPRVIVAWSTALKCPKDVDYLDETIVLEKRAIQ